MFLSSQISFQSYTLQRLAKTRQRAGSSLGFYAHSPALPVEQKLCSLTLNLPARRECHSPSQSSMMKVEVPQQRFLTGTQLLHVEVRLLRFSFLISWKAPYWWITAPLCFIIGTACFLKQSPSIRRFQIIINFFWKGNVIGLRKITRSQSYKYKHWKRLVLLAGNVMSIINLELGDQTSQF